VSAGKYIAAITKPFDVQFGRLIERVRRLQSCIEDDARAGALVMQLVQTKSLVRHKTDSYLRRNRKFFKLRPTEAILTQSRFRSDPPRHPRRTSDSFVPRNQENIIPQF
jgi:hypothetical protein